MNRFLIATFTGAVLLSACAFDADRHDQNNQEEFGAAVNNMVRAQTYNPNASTSQPQGLDGDKAANSVKAYRSDRKSATPVEPLLLLPTSSAP